MFSVSKRCSGKGGMKRWGFSSMLASHRSICSAGQRDAPGKNERDDSGSVQWAVICGIGSTLYQDYRHQADVCHAFQLLKRGGLKEENIIVFMDDSIAQHPWNPRPGILINHPDGIDVYAGVPKDYTGENMTSDNFYEVLLGNRSSVCGGSGKVVDSKPNDYIFIYFAGHGYTLKEGGACLEMPLDDIEAPLLFEVLRQKKASGSFKEIVPNFFMDLPEDLKTYVVTASDIDEGSLPWYCQRSLESPPPPDYEVCVGDLFSISWMEHSESHDRKAITVGRQFEEVKERVGNPYKDATTHAIKLSPPHAIKLSPQHLFPPTVREFGDKRIRERKLYLFLGYDPDGPNLKYLWASAIGPYNEIVILGSVAAYNIHGQMLLALHFTLTLVLSLTTFSIPTHLSIAYLVTASLNL
ncbi:vacuolar-processing enzyme beta-isozyme-like [Lycium ferocissimum]|uniref:vacuolar-processing enzyme beta-isozyme-like n=1 Tax=Lycium ferocissimum TaxID=112874 RepID=UPI002815BB68|nr:vacuolar-processing enzyme beta-isozyme-like [Lycium ferocissimum]